VAAPDGEGVGARFSGLGGALALEFVDGPTLADRIDQGRIPPDEALAISRQIIDALEAAHEAGVVHRDLKPANIKLRPDGAVKVLDFGLAKLTQPGNSGSFAPGVTASPTITTPAMTGIGVILGTAAYMAPEQARGKPVDKRADVWAFGCVLYEMLTGRRAFDGDDVTMVTANIVKSEPDWNALPAETPDAVRAVLRGCLQKDPRRRIRDIGDVRLAIEGAFYATDTQRHVTATATSSSRFRRALPWVAGAVAGSVLTGAATWTALKPAGATPTTARRFTVTLPQGHTLPPGTGTMVAISPDGQILIYRVLQRDGIFRLYRRDLNQFEATPIGEANAGAYVFFSPDSQWLAYAVATTLKKIRLSGGPPQTLCELPVTTPRSAAWGNDGTIIVGATTAGLLRVPAAGGTCESIAMPPPGRGFWYPQRLPGGQAILFTSSSQNPDAGDLEILRLDTGERRMLVPGVAGRYLPSGHLVFVRGGTLWAAGFDLENLSIVGTPVPAVEGIRVEGGGAVQFAVADDGSLVYVPGGTGAVARRLVWVDRNGTEEAIAAPPRSYTYPRISPDGTRVAVDINDQEDDIWTWDFARSTLTRLTFGAAGEQYPAWTRDGRRLIFSSAREKTLAPFWQAADGTGVVERLASSPEPLDQTSLSPDGKQMVLRALSPATRGDIVMVALEGERRVEPLIHTQFDERNPELSPDGRWLAYQSNESGQFEIYVRPFPRVDEGRWQVSTGGGAQPLWERSGRALYYIADGVMMRVPVEAGATFSYGNPVRTINVAEYLLDPVGRPYDISPDGRRFLMIRNDTMSGAATINVVLNWTEELKRLVRVD
jgi:eukaryotic-like serine/threonine-protein kinase